MEHSPRPLAELLNLKPASLAQVMELRDSGVEALDLDAVPAAEEGNPLPWSPMLLSVQYAQQRGLVKSGGPDHLKAGMEILEKAPYAQPLSALALNHDVGSVVHRFRPYRICLPREVSLCSSGRRRPRFQVPPMVDSSALFWDLGCVILSSFPFQ